ncbi:MAG: type II toxin-antitoxin system VapC family toxin [Opitutales bacterium]|nr:type II toxin-antitoxin system VapC family toxin [Opitutales bacterium]
MNLLLDTCALLWALQAPDHLSLKARRALLNPSNPIHVSTVSFWEISLKFSLGKLTLENAVPGDFPQFVRDEGWHIEPLNAEAAAAFCALSRVSGHKDPFGRLLIHIAIREGYHFVSRDAAAGHYADYGLRVCW